MKRYRHYNKGTAVILSCFGSVVEQDRYLELAEFIGDNLEDVSVYTAFNSRMVLKLLKKQQGKEFKNTPQTLADCDMEGYKRIVVASVNIFPTSEHEELQKVVDGFGVFSLSNIRLTKAVFSSAKATTKILSAIDSELREADGEAANIYIVHGSPDLDFSGNGSISYAKELLTTLGENNFFCSLEGALPFWAIKEKLISDIKKLPTKNGKHKVRLVPLLLVSGNHFDKDVVEMVEELSTEFDVEIAKPLGGGEKFNLIERDDVRATIAAQIKEEIKKLG